MLRRIVLAALVALPCLVGGAIAEDLSPYQRLLTPLLESSETTIGQPFAYPAGTSKLTAAVVNLQPGQETSWHSHEVPLFGFMLEGALTVDYGSKGKRVYNAGESWIEAIDWPHNGTNAGTGPARLLAVYMGGGDKANTLTSPAP